MRPRKTASSPQLCTLLGLAGLLFGLPAAAAQGSTEVQDWATERRAKDFERALGMHQEERKPNRSAEDTAPELEETRTRREAPDDASPAGSGASQLLLLIIVIPAAAFLLFAIIMALRTSSRSSASRRGSKTSKADEKDEDDDEEANEAEEAEEEPEERPPEAVQGPPEAARVHGSAESEAELRAARAAFAAADWPRAIHHASRALQLEARKRIPRSTPGDTPERLATALAKGSRQVFTEGASLHGLVRWGQRAADVQRATQMLHLADTLAASPRPAQAARKRGVPS